MFEKLHKYAVIIIIIIISFLFCGFVLFCVGFTIGACAVKPAR